MGRRIFKYSAAITSIFSNTLCVQTVAPRGAGHAACAYACGIKRLSKKGRNLSFLIYKALGCMG